VLFVDKQPVGVIEAKKETLGHNITTVEDQTKDYADAKLKWVQHTGQPLPFLYEATGVLTRFTDQRDPKPRSREVFTFHRPETLRELLSQEKSLRARLLELPALIADLDNLPEPADLADEIIDNIEAGLASFRAVAAALQLTGTA
jgi:type I restriction enzyme R subunit